MKKQNFLKAISLIMLFALCITVFASCKNADGGTGTNGYLGNFDLNNERGEPEKEEAGENPFIKTSNNNVSTFSANVNTASYTRFRRLITSGATFDQVRYHIAGELRTEEMINYFNYTLAQPAEGELFGTTVQIGKASWNNESYLMMLGLKSTESITYEKNNLVFLIDVSGSMNSSDKLKLLQETFSYLTERLGADDVVSIVTYAAGEKIVLDGCEGSQTQTILSAINGLKAEGATNGEAGLKKAYELASKHFISDGNNRIILATDGDLNVGMSTPEEIKNFVAQKRETGVFLSVLGYGTGNYRDDTLEAIAHEGNGMYHYVDGKSEAEKIFTTDLFSSLYTVAKDVKLQITFDEKYIESYRLIGYETRILNSEDFENDEKDAGEVGAGHSVVVCYELKLTEDALNTEKQGSSGWMTLAVRYKNPLENESILKDYNIGLEYYTEEVSDDFIFVSAVIETAMVIIDSKYKGTATIQSAYSKISDIVTDDYYKTEFAQLVGKLT